MAYGSTININVSISKEADVSTCTIINVRPYCYNYMYNITSGKCDYLPRPCYLPPRYSTCIIKPIYIYTNTCTPNKAVSLCQSCEDGYLTYPLNELSVMIAS